MVFLCLLAVLSNVILLSSCDLLRYEGGSLGLRTYAHEETGECTLFVTLEDQALKAAQSASYVALAAGMVFLAIAAFHTFIQSIPGKDPLLSTCVMLLELCLLDVYSAQNNGICEVEGCIWGNAIVWLAIAQLAFVAASVGSWYSNKSYDGKDYHWSLRSFCNSQNETLRRSQRSIDLEA